jgi:hypothetical protein
VYERESITVHIGDQADRRFWSRVKQEVPEVDILIDDGGHKPFQQIVTFEEMYPHLRPGGVYICEDVHGVLNLFHAYVAGFSGNLNFVGTQPNPCQQATASVHLYPFLIVIEKPASPPGQFVAPKHGTLWQPFLGPV